MPWTTTADVLTALVSVFAVALTVATALSLATPDSRYR